MYSVRLAFTEDTTLKDGYEDEYSFSTGEEVLAQIHDRGVIILLNDDGRLKWSTLFPLSDLSKVTDIVKGARE